MLLHCRLIIVADVYQNCAIDSVGCSSVVSQKEDVYHVAAF